MLVNKDIIAELCENAGDTRYQKALEYVEDKRVTIKNVNYENKNNFEFLDEKKYSNVSSGIIRELIQNGNYKECEKYCKYCCKTIE